MVLQEIQKSIALGLVPIINLAEQVLNPINELDRNSIKTALTDSFNFISLGGDVTILGHILMTNIILFAIQTFLFPMNYLKMIATKG